MKSAVFYGKHDMRVEEYEKPKIGPKEALVAVKACGVCGTDVHIFEGDKGSVEVTPPAILGHEFSGIIVETGKDITNFKTGDRVCVDPNCYCGTCDACRSGIPHYCRNFAPWTSASYIFLEKIPALNRAQWPSPSPAACMESIYAKYGRDTRSL